MENCDGLSANNYNYNSLPTTPAVEIKSSFQVINQSINQYLPKTPAVEIKSSFQIIINQSINISIYY